MTLLILQLRPNLRQQNLQLVQRPPRIKRKQPQTKPLDPIQHGTQLQQSRIPESLLCRPGPNRQTEFEHVDVDEPGFLEVGAEQGAGGAETETDFQSGFPLLDAPLEERGSGVFGGGLDDAHVVHFLEFDVTAGFDVSMERSELYIPVRIYICK